MTDEMQIERSIATWMADQVAGSGSDEVLGQILSTTGRLRPEPRWLALVKERPMLIETRVAVGSPTGRLVLLAALILTLAIAVAGVGAAVLFRPQPTFNEPLSIVRSYSPTSLGLNHAIALSIAPSGDLYVTDENEQVIQITRDGHVVRRWGSHGGGPGQFWFKPADPNANTHGSIAVGPDGKVYVSDNLNRRVQVFAADGTFLRQFGSLGSMPGQFVQPFDLSADAAGNVYVIDDQQERLTKFSPTGAVLWVADATTDALLAGHGHGAHLDSLGRIVLGNDDTGRVIVVDPDGKVVDSFAAADACETNVDHAGNFYVTRCSADRTNVYAPDHSFIGAQHLAIHAPEFGPGDEVAALGADGTILFLKVFMPES